MSREPECGSRCRHLVACDGSQCGPFHANWGPDREWHIWFQREGLPPTPENTACEQFAASEVDA